MLNLIKKDLILYFTKKRIGTFLLGVLIIFIISTSWHTKKETKADPYLSIGVVDQDNSQYSKLMLSYFENNEVFTDYVKLTIGNKEQIEELFSKGELSGYLVIPHDFAQNLIDIVNVPMEAYIHTQDITKAILLKNMLAAYETYISAVESNCVALYDAMKVAGMPAELCEKENVKISMNLVLTALGKSDFFQIQEVNGVAHVPIAVYYIIEVIFLMLCYLSMMAGMDLIKERRQGVVLRLRTTGMKYSTILLEKVLFYNGVFLVVLAGVYGVLRIGNRIIPLSFFCFIFLFFIISSMFFLLFSAFFKKLPTYLLLSNIMILFGAVMGGGILPVMFLPDIMKKTAEFMINNWFIRISSACYMSGESVPLPIVIFTGLFVIFALFIATVVMNRTEGVSHEDV